MSKQVESTIIGFEEESPVLYRLGSISIEEVEAVIGVLKIQSTQEAPIAPGMLSKHYAPKLKLFYQTILRSNFI
jgi:L-threonylcarbamoyladenylate synthase